MYNTRESHINQRHAYTCMHDVDLLNHMKRMNKHIAGGKIKFAPGKSLQFSNFPLTILFFELRYTVFIPEAVEWIHKSPTAIFSQPMFLIND